MGNQVSSILLGKKFSVSQCRKQGYAKDIVVHSYTIYTVYYPVDNGTMNMGKAVEDLNYILSTENSPACAGLKISGWDGGIRTPESRDQNPLPYHLATSHQ